MFSNKSLVFCIVFVTAVKLASCGIGMLQSPIHPDHPDQCYWKKTNTLLSVGSRYRLPDQCGEAVCELNETGGLFFRITTCAPYLVSDPNCREVAPDLSLPFAECCMIYECTDAEGQTKRV